MKTTIWKSWTLSCAHRLPHVLEGHKCGRMHGHNFVLEVHVSGPVQKDGGSKGMVVDFAALDRVWQQHVHGQLDHGTLNDVPGLDNPTSENVARWVWDVFEAWLPSSVSVVKVVVQEKDTSGAMLEASHA
ncbi:6-carboxytetrahydropterin synthase QueD [Corallococcus sp. CA047B]|uniref:6-carboxytetrahydropterin synthase QueD n=1 Tax=Corallococcus sp. CA047B TaxID=2316729 RepID=UPI000EA09424|nr:6-carboxytetrahydropterin synthase QueD [Corallococcus sp. CA047B]RKH01482.1 6-carboxytetrahydropterin synthase QueD [Corallococcus sp. CA047B]